MIQMSQFNSFISKAYLKSFFFIFISLQIFFVTLDFILIYEDIPNSANLTILYIVYSFVFSMHIMFPISIAIGFVVAMSRLINSNEYISFLALGYSKKQIIHPIFITSLLLTFLFIGLNSTNLAYAEDNKRSIINNQYVNYSQKNIFIKYFNDYVYIEKIFLELKKAENIKIFTFDDDKNLIKIAHAKEAFFEDGSWIIKNATITKIGKNFNFENSSLKISTSENIKILNGFNPVMIRNMYNKKNLSSIKDAINALIVLNKQGADTRKHRIIIYQYGIIPLFAPILLIIIFFYAPYTKRVGHIDIFTSLFIFISIIIFGSFVSIAEMAQKMNNVSPEIIIFTPMLILCSIAISKYRKLI